MTDIKIPRQIRTYHLHCGHTVQFSIAPKTGDRLLCLKCNACTHVIDPPKLDCESCEGEPAVMLAVFGDDGSDRTTFALGNVCLSDLVGLASRFDYVELTSAC